MLSNYYTFSSLRGKQGNNHYYLIQCPLQLVPRLFSFDKVKATGTGFRYTALSATKIEKLERYLESHAVVGIARQLGQFVYRHPASLS